MLSYFLITKLCIQDLEISSKVCKYIKSFHNSLPVKVQQHSISKANAEVINSISRLAKRSTYCLSIVDSLRKPLGNHRYGDLSDLERFLATYGWTTVGPLLTNGNFANRSARWTFFNFNQHLTTNSQRLPSIGENILC